MDVIEGKISCTPQQAVELASYCMQAEFGKLINNIALLYESNNINQQFV